MKNEKTNQTREWYIIEPLEESAREFANIKTANTENIDHCQKEFE